MGTTGKLFFNHNTPQWGTDWYQGFLRHPDVRSQRCAHLSLSSGVFLGSFVAFCRSKHRNARVTDCDEGTREPGAGRGFTQGPHHPRGRFRGLEPWAPDRGGQATRCKAPRGQHWRLERRVEGSGFSSPRPPSLQARQPHKPRSPGVMVQAVSTHPRGATQPRPPLRSHQPMCRPPRRCRAGLPRPAPRAVSTRPAPLAHTSARGLPTCRVQRCSWWGTCPAGFVGFAKSPPKTVNSQLVHQPCMSVKDPWTRPEPDSISILTRPEPDSVTILDPT